MANGSLDAFCGSPFWNTTRTWESENPDFTICFEKTVLAWIPCILLWGSAPLEGHFIVKSKDRKIRWNCLNISKQILTISLAVQSLADMGHAAFFTQRGSTTYLVDHYTPLIKMASFLLCAVLQYFNQRNGIRSSGLISLFWVLSLVCGIPQYRTELTEELNKEIYFPYFQLTDATKMQWPFVSYMLYLPMVFVMFVLNCFADSRPMFQYHQVTEKMFPELEASFFNKLFYFWYDPLGWQGYRKTLTFDDLWTLKPEDTAKEISSTFLRYWEQSVRKCYGMVGSSPLYGRFYITSARAKSTKNRASIMPAVLKYCGLPLMGAFAIKLVIDLLTFVNPQLLKLLIAFVKSASDPQLAAEPAWRGYLYAVGVLVSGMLSTILFGQYYYRVQTLGARVRIALITAMYQKALRLSNSARKEATVGEIVNLVSVDTERIDTIVRDFAMLWSAPMLACVSLYFLWGILGPSALAGLGVLIVLIPINGYLGSKVEKLDHTRMKFQDERSKVMNEVLNGIKVIKLYAWEPSFVQKILNIREKEIALLRKNAVLGGAFSFIWACTPFLVSLVSFATYILVDKNNILDTSKAFVSLSLFNILRVPLDMVARLIPNLVQAVVSTKRINKFMNLEELDPENVSHDADHGAAIVIQGGTFAWGSGESPTLKNIDLSVRSGSLVAVVGTVGCGKSSLVAALLGEMDRVSGRVNTQGSVAYVPQQAWIQNATLKENVLFGRAEDARQYARTVRACALEPDLEILSGGDQTEIGERGINLSGGQKQRVSLARAVYHDADVYLLDDPLSAVDSHVGKHIFENVIGPHGLLKGKTRVLVTHSITFLPEVDLIVVLKDGEVFESGTYRELLARKGEFAAFLLRHLHGSSEEDDDLESDVMRAELEETLGPEKVLKELKEVRRRKTQRSESENSAQSDTGTASRRNRRISESSGGSFQRLSGVSSEVHPAPREAGGERLVEEEKIETGNVKWGVYLSYIKQIGVPCAVSTLVLLAILQGFSMGSSVWLSIWSGDPSMANGTHPGYREKCSMYLGVYGALGFGQAVGSVLSRVVPLLGCVSAARAIHRALLHGVIRAPLSFFDSTPIGRILSRFGKDVDVVDEELPVVFMETLSILSEVITTFVVISYTLPQYIGVVIPVCILYGFLQRFYVATARQIRRLTSVARSPIFSHVSESVTGASSIRAFSATHRFVLQADQKIDLNQSCFFADRVSNRWLVIRMEMLGNLVVFFVAFFAVLGRNASLSPGLVALSITYALEITPNLNWLLRLASYVETDIVAVERIKEYTETPQEAAWDVASTVDSFWPQKGAIDFKEYRLRYREGLEPVLKGINFSINGGEKVGIVGRTGAGKSSLTLALFRIVEAAGGRVLIDGVDVATLGLHALRSRLTIIPQDPVLFSGSLRSNLDPFEEFSDVFVWAALQRAHLSGFVSGLDAGLQHEVSEGGENLSVGQRQLVCLARALLRKTKVLILDEATASVDLETDDLIQKTIRADFKDCTILTIAHRLNTIMDADRVLVLDDGNVVEFDSPSSLLAKKESTFYSLAKDAGLA